MELESLSVKVSFMKMTYGQNQLTISNIGAEKAMAIIKLLARNEVMEEGIEWIQEELAKKPVVPSSAKPETEIQWGQEHVDVPWVFSVPARMKDMPSTVGRRVCRCVVGWSNSTGDGSFYFNEECPNCYQGGPLRPSNNEWGVRIETVPVLASIKRSMAIMVDPDRPSRVCRCVGFYNGFLYYDLDCQSCYHGKGPTQPTGTSEP
jgi:hypothetical protein